MNTKVQGEVNPTRLLHYAGTFLVSCSCQVGIGSERKTVVSECNRSINSEGFVVYATE